MVMLGEDGVIHVWDIASCDTMVTHKGHEDAILGIAYSPCGKLLASCSHDNTIRVWDTNTRLACTNFKWLSWYSKLQPISSLFRHWKWYCASFKFYTQKQSSCYGKLFSRITNSSQFLHLIYSQNWKWSLYESLSALIFIKYKYHENQHDDK